MSMQLQLKAKTNSASVPSFTLMQKNLQHNCFDNECAEQHQKNLTLQQRSTNQTISSNVPSIVQEVLRSPGQPLNPETRAFMEPRLGHNFSRIQMFASMSPIAKSELTVSQPGDKYEQQADHEADHLIGSPKSDMPHYSINPQDLYDLSQVRVHIDEKAAKSARAVDALAYTIGRDIVFGEGQYAPQTTEGQRLLAHELVHVVQQTGTYRTFIRRANERSASVPTSQQNQCNCMFLARKSDQTASKKNKEQVIKIQIGTPSGEAIFISASGKIFKGKVDTDLAVGRYKLIPKISSRQWIIPHTRTGLRFYVVLEEENPWDLSYPDFLWMDVVSGTPQITIGEILSLEDTLPITGDPENHPNYIQNVTKSVGIPILGGSFYLYHKSTPATGVDPDSIQLSRSMVNLNDDPANDATKINYVYKKRELADAAMSRSGFDKAYSYYVGYGGHIYPTVISNTTASVLCSALRQSIEKETEYSKAASHYTWVLGLTLLLSRFSPVNTSAGDIAAEEAVLAQRSTKAMDKVLKGQAVNEAAGNALAARGAANARNIAQAAAARAVAAGKSIAPETAAARAVAAGKSIASEAKSTAKVGESTAELGESTAEVGSAGTSIKALKDEARLLVKKLKNARKKVIVNFGGRFELKDAINVNPNYDNVKNLPNLVKARAEEVGSIFDPGTVDEIFSRNIERGWVNWIDAAKGAYDILKPGGKVKIMPFTSDIEVHLIEIKYSLQQAGFKNVTIVDRAVIAVKP